MTLTTHSLLRSLGAEEDPTMMQDGDVGLKLQIGPHSLECGEFTSRWFTPTFRVGGIINTGRTLSLVESEMPVELETEDEGFAWLAEILRGAIPEELKPAWLLKGEGLRHLLPHCGQRSMGRPGVSVWTRNS